MLKRLAFLHPSAPEVAKGFLNLIKFLAIVHVVQEHAIEITLVRGPTLLLCTHV
jgi:hypothetical protein